MNRAWFQDLSASVLLSTTADEKKKKKWNRERRRVLVLNNNKTKVMVCKKLEGKYLSNCHLSITVGVTQKKKKKRKSRLFIHSVIQNIYIYIIYNICSTADIIGTYHDIMEKTKPKLGLACYVHCS